MNWFFLFFSFTGRISRSQFWTGLLILLGVELLFFWPLLQIYGADLRVRPAPLWFRNLNLLLDTALAWPTLAVMVKRQRDRDQSAHLSYLSVSMAIAYSALDAFGVVQTKAGATPLGYLAGVVSVGLLAIVIVELGARAGVPVRNRYGEPPLEQGNPDT
jgi:uncharacterized membrane protein YhaH (DUF805 family)